MPRKPRDLKHNYCYHVTVLCNNREFKLIRHECREVFLYALKKAREKFHFKLYALCIMSNHVHYLLEPAAPEDLPRILHWLNLNNPRTKKLGAVYVAEHRDYWEKLSFYFGYLLKNNWIEPTDIIAITKALKSDYAYPPTYSKAWIDNQHELID